MGCNVENYNYEDILEIFQSEKHSSDLKTLTKEHLAKIRQYLVAKESLLQKTSNKDLRFKLQIEIENAERAIRDLYSKREQKIIGRAIFTARSEYKIKDTTDMLPKEELFYTQLIELFISGHKAFYSTLEQSSDELRVKDAAESLKTPHKTLKFKEEVPELLDLKENKHGPFKPNDTAELPDELAKILVAQNKAYVVET